MKHVRTYESFRNYKNYEPINEEIFGKIVDFFKNLWGKATEELKKLGENPSIDKVEDWVDKNPMNPADDTYIFKGLMDEFAKKPEANEQDCLDLIKNILDPETGALGTQGLQPLYDNIIKAFGNDSSTLDIIQYLMETIRNRAIKDYKYAGGPDLKVGQPAKIDPKKIIVDMKDTTHLPDFKKVILTAAQDNKKRKQLTIDWVNKTLVPRLDKYLSETSLKDEEIEKYIQSKGKEVPEAGPEGGYKAGDTVIYKRTKFNADEWKKVTDEDKKKPEEGIMKDLEDKEMIGIKQIKEVKGDDVIFEKEDGTTFTKKISDLLGAIEGAKAEGQEELVKKLGEIKSKKPEDIKKVSSYVDFISDEKNKDKVAEIDKIMSAGEGE
jgi:hypothetical protein